jgi:hypothetical protein
MVFHWWSTVTISAIMTSAVEPDGPRCTRGLRLGSEALFSRLVLPERRATLSKEAEVSPLIFLG